MARISQTPSVHSRVVNAEHTRNPTRLISLAVANVNPAVPHPRWSQATERVLGTPRRVKTQIYNGYGDYVAHLYKDLEGERLFA